MYQYFKKGIGEIKMMKRLTALLLCAMLAISMFAGCGNKVDKTATVATLEDTKVSLGLANFVARLQQAQYDDFYVMYFGENVWRTDMYGYGTTMEDDLKSSVLESIYAMYAMKEHAADYGIELTTEEKAAISTAAASFISSNSADAIEALGATQEIVEEYLALLTIQTKMYNEIIKDVDTNVSDEEANMSAYSYIRVSRSTYVDAEGNSVSHTEDTLAELATTMEAFMADVETMGLDEAAKAHDYNMYTGTFAADMSGLTTEVAEALKVLAEGEVSGLIETSTQYYVVRLDANTDEAATESNRQTIISERQTALYTEVVEGFMDEFEWKVNAKVWAQVKFDNLFTTIEESEDSTELN